MGIIYELSNADHQVMIQFPFSNWFTEGFMRHYTRFSSFEDFLTDANLKLKSRGETKSVFDDNTFQNHVTQTTEFKSWEEMKQCAKIEYAKRNFINRSL